MLQETEASNCTLTSNFACDFEQCEKRQLSLATIKPIAPYPHRWRLVPTTAAANTRPKNSVRLFETLCTDTPSPRGPRLQPLVLHPLGQTKTPSAQANENNLTAVVQYSKTLMIHDHSDGQFRLYGCLSKGNPF